MCGFIPWMAKARERRLLAHDGTTRGRWRRRGALPSLDHQVVWRGRGPPCGGRTGRLGGRWGKGCSPRGPWYAAARPPPPSPFLSHRIVPMQMGVSTDALIVRRNVGSLRIRGTRVGVERRVQRADPHCAGEQGGRDMHTARWLAMRSGALAAPRRSPPAAFFLLVHQSRPFDSHT